ncbi:hypothetical protein R6242_17465 [Iodobacter sp. CM08]|uniref:hypothetical protein n=1 Tax=Iodobacter sp. CM08 TaxID=3085902 RepID=UPI0029815D06|nr:hypothetical protein [Iodobacter sp. CM08]MDW5418358.1 hypothetical protein [Iodobacter sp. CM08]
MKVNQLKTNEIFSAQASKTWIHCATGMIWLSHNGLDTILSCGQKWQLQGADLLVIQALEDSCFALHQTAQLARVEQVGFFSSSPKPSGC